MSAYSPEISPERMEQVRSLSRRLRKPMTVIVDEAIQVYARAVERYLTTPICKHLPPAEGAASTTAALRESANTGTPGSPPSSRSPARMRRPRRSVRYGS